MALESHGRLLSRFNGRNYEVVAMTPRPAGIGRGGGGGHKFRELWALSMSSPGTGQALGEELMTGSSPK